MTTWGARRIARFATEAGFPPADVPLATAIAWAATSGADHYQHNPGVGIGSERRGLWAMRMDEIPKGMAVDLWNPDHAAQLARITWEANGKHWLWHPAAASGAVDAVIELVNAVLSGHVRVVSDAPAEAFRSGLSRLQDMRQQIVAQRIVRG